MCSKVSRALPADHTGILWGGALETLRIHRKTYNCKRCKATQGNINLNLAPDEENLAQLLLVNRIAFAFFARPCAALHAFRPLRQKTLRYFLARIWLATFLYHIQSSNKYMFQVSFSLLICCCALSNRAPDCMQNVIPRINFPSRESPFQVKT